LVVLGVLAAIVYGAMVALVITVEPSVQEESIRISSDRLRP
jgi:energy-converting hydrogenase Eha subunit A